MISGVAIAGSLYGFLFSAKYPARIFMGDTGSMALGGVLSAIAIVSKTEFCFNCRYYLRSESRYL